MKVPKVPEVPKVPRGSVEKVPRVPRRQGCQRCGRQVCQGAGGAEALVEEDEEERGGEDVGPAGVQIVRSVTQCRWTTGSEQVGASAAGNLRRMTY